MKSALILGITSAACLLLFFVAPYARRKESSTKRYTLAAMYGDLFHELPSMKKAKIEFFLPMACAGILSSFYPALMLVIIRVGGQQSLNGARMFILLPAIVSLLGVVVNVLVMLLSQLNFGFGGSQKRNETVIFWVILAFQATFAIFGIAAAISADVAKFVYGFIA